MKKDIFKLMGSIFQILVMIYFMITTIQITFFNRKITNEDLYIGIFAGMLYVRESIKQEKEEDEK